MIGLENSRHPLNQSDAKLKPIATWGRLHVFTLSSHWLLVVFTFVLIGRCDYFGFGLRLSIEKRCNEIIDQKYYDHVNMPQDDGLINK